MGLGAWFRKLITINTIDGLIGQGTLTPYRTFAPDTPDLSRVRVMAGEFVEADLDEAMRPRKLVANIEVNQFTAEQLGDLVQTTLGDSSPRLVRSGFTPSGAHGMPMDGGMN